MLKCLQNLVRILDSRPDSGQDKKQTVPFCNILTIFFMIPTLIIKSFFNSYLSQKKPSKSAVKSQAKVLVKSLSDP
jgi:MFS-type transporter involved in bile tolerance (Atg22 family)